MITRECVDLAIAKMAARTVDLNEHAYKTGVLFSMWRNARAGRGSWVTVEALAVGLINWIGENRRSFPNADKHIESYRFLAEVANSEIDGGAF